MAMKHGHRYPWDEWFSCSNFQIRHGEHYDCRSDSMAQQVRQAAKRKGFTVKITIPDDAKGLSVTVKKRKIRLIAAPVVVAGPRKVL